MSPAIILSDRWLEALCRSQGIRYDHTTRVIIDAKAGEPVWMYVTQLGTDDLLELEPPDISAPRVRRYIKNADGRDVEIGTQQAAPKQDGEAPQADGERGS